MCVRDEDLHADTDQRDLVLLNKLIDTSKKRELFFFFLLNIPTNEKNKTAAG